MEDLNYSELPSELEDHPLMQDDADLDEVAEFEPESIPPVMSGFDNAAAQRELELLKERNSQLMRIAADFENYKRRQEREREESAKFAGQQLITNLLPVLDNFERALQAESVSEEMANFVEGVRMIHRQFLDVLTKTGVTPVEAMGEPFNPEYHEAIMSEANDEVPDETVIGEFQRGYVMHGRLLRPAVVKVSKLS